MLQLRFLEAAGIKIEQLIRRAWSLVQNWRINSTYRRHRRVFVIVKYTFHSQYYLFVLLGNDTRVITDDPSCFIKQPVPPSVEDISERIRHNTIEVVNLK